MSTVVATTVAVEQTPVTPTPPVGESEAYVPTTIVTSTLFPDQPLPPLGEGSSSRPPSPNVEDLEESFVQYLIKSFFEGLEECLNFVLQGIRTPFDVMKKVLLSSLENIRAASNEERVAPYRQMLEQLEQDVQRWHGLRQMDPTSTINEEWSTLVSEIEAARVEARRQVDASEANLAATKAEQGEVAETMTVIQQQMTSAKRSIHEAHQTIARARQMLERAQRVLDQSQPDLAAHQGQLALYMARNVHLIEQEHKVAQELSAARATYEETMHVVEENMRRVAVERAEARRAHGIALVERDLRAYVQRPRQL